MFGLEELGIRVGFCPWRMVAAVMYTHAQPPTSKCWDRTQSVGEGGIAAVHAGNSEGVVFRNNILRALLVVRRQVAIG